MKDEVEGQAAFLGIERSYGGWRWQARNVDERLGIALAQRLGVPEMVGRLLAGRGIGFDEADGFLNPSLRSSLPDPALFLDMEKAAQRIARQIMEGGGIAIFGDYDVDGATSTALLYRFLTAVGASPAFYIPDRLREGYGPNGPALLALHRQGAGLAIAVDCGTSAHEALAQAAAVGLEVVVCDHHAGEALLPQAYAVVNPNRLDETAGYRYLAAVGVSFLLAVAVNRALRQAGWYRNGHEEPDLLQWLDLVALGTVCDVVPLIGLNRAFVAQGIKILRQRRCPGLCALSDISGLKEQPESYHLGYALGPRINAGGRVGQADLGVRLLISVDRQEALSLAEQLDRLNDERRSIEAQTLDRAIAQVEARGANETVVFAWDRGWHAGVIGIVAARLKDRFQRPAWVATVEGGIVKASGRSVAGVSLGDIVIAARQAGLLTHGGGHAMAAGFTAEEERMPAIVAFMKEKIALATKGKAAQAVLHMDGALDCGAVTAEFFSHLLRLEPYGTGNSEPRFAIRAARVVRADVVGERHVRAFLAGHRGGRLKAIAFRAVDTPVGQALLQAHGRCFHVAGQLKPDLWSGPEAMQLFIDDVAEA